MQRIIILAGPRCAGKTTTGRLLASRLNWSFVDSDEEVEREAGQSISDIFASEGESGFRAREAATLANLCKHGEVVVATGGGAVLNSANRALMKAAGFVVWLCASAETLWERMQSDPNSSTRRPNLTSFDGLEEVRNNLSAREVLYREVADFHIVTDTQSPEVVADTILSAWNGGSTYPPASGA